MKNETFFNQKLFKKMFSQTFRFSKASDPYFQGVLGWVCEQLHRVLQVQEIFKTAVEPSTQNYNHF
jgi:hypothetical protein